MKEVPGEGWQPRRRDWLEALRDAFASAPGWRWKRSERKLLYWWLEKRGVDMANVDPDEFNSLVDQVTVIDADEELEKLPPEEIEQLRGLFIDGGKVDNFGEEYGNYLNGGAPPGASINFSISPQTLFNVAKVAALVLPKRIKDRCFEPAFEDLKQEYLAGLKLNRARSNFGFMIRVSFIVLQSFQTSIVEPFATFLERLWHRFGM